MLDYRNDSNVILTVCVHQSISDSSLRNTQIENCFIPFLQIPGHQAVFINEPRLSDFKQVLLREGIQAEFVGGVLVCNNMVAVRRVSVLPRGSCSKIPISIASSQTQKVASTVNLFIICL